MFQHFIITQFSYRGAFGLRTKGFNRDPLRRKNLEHRFRMFEMCCLPSILGQVAQDFTWILIVDPKLPAHYRSRLEELVGQRENSIIHTFEKHLALDSFGWMKPYIKPSAEHIFTTHLDDDDALFTGFTQYIKKHYDNLKAKGSVPYIKFFGCNNAIQWDFFWSSASPLGYTKPWTRTQSLPVSAGLTLLSKYPEIDFTIKYFPHHEFELLKPGAFDSTSQASSHLKSIVKKQQTIKSAAINSHADWDGILTPDINFHYIETKSPQVVMVNHFNNIQYLRMLEAPHLRQLVEVESSFPGLAIDFDLAERNIRGHQKSISLLLKLAIRAIQFKTNGNSHLGLFRKLKEIVTRLNKTITGVRNM